MKNFFFILLFASSLLAAESLDDSQILNIMMTVDKGEIGTANEVLKKPLSGKVGKYAVYLIQQHQANLDQLQELGRKLKLEPQASNISASLERDGQKDLQSIESQEGPAFEKAYIDAMVKEHQGGIEAIDNTLIPAAQNAQLKASLYKFRTMVHDHLEKALEIQKSF